MKSQTISSKNWETLIRNGDRVSPAAMMARQTK